MGSTVTTISFTVAFISIIAGIVTIVWFIKDMRKENSKMLKIQAETLVKIEEGQRTGFQSLAEGQKTMNEGQKSIEKGLENIAKILENITKIFERITINLKKQ